jgi:uncharacterized damage-inducible protein DinB
MRLNPYAAHLGERRAEDVLPTTAEELRRLTDRLPDARLVRRPSAERWSIGDILCHLADTELVFAVRLRHTVAEAHHQIQPYDQNAWAASAATLDATLALHTFAAVRRWNIAFINAVMPAARDRPVTHPERGTMQFVTIVETMAGHDINHLKQVEALVEMQMEGERGTDP